MRNSGGVKSLVHTGEKADKFLRNLTFAFFILQGADEGWIIR